MVEYSLGYLADHWCQRGTCSSAWRGLRTELHDGRGFVLRPGMSYQVADGAEAHCSSTEAGAVLFIVDEGVTGNTHRILRGKDPGTTG